VGLGEKNVQDVQSCFLVLKKAGQKTGVLKYCGKIPRVLKKVELSTFLHIGGWMS
jgi:hypothetical protein